MKNKMSVGEYIDIMVDNSKTPQNELILECLEKYNLMGNRELQRDQARMFCEEKGLLDKKKDDKFNYRLN